MNASRESCAYHSSRGYRLDKVSEMCGKIVITVKESGLSFYKAVAISQTNNYCEYRCPRVPLSLTGVATYARALVH